MEDRELLELAAKACGIGPILCYESARNCLRIGPRANYRLWRPLDDDTDALKIAMRLGICINLIPDCDTVQVFQQNEYAEPRNVKTEALDDFGVRRAIVRAAAEIGRDMP